MVITQKKQEHFVVKKVLKRAKKGNYDESQKIQWYGGLSHEENARTSIRKRSPQKTLAEAQLHADIIKEALAKK